MKPCDVLAVIDDATKGQREAVEISSKNAFVSGTFSVWVGAFSAAGIFFLLSAGHDLVVNSGFSRPIALSLVFSAAVSFAVGTVLTGLLSLILAYHISIHADRILLY
jgi:hypothetical protein